MNNYDKIGELVALIKQIPIVEILTLRIRPSGYGYEKWICPFHDDHTPNNFKILKDKVSYRCYACGAHGNGINFIMDYDGISFKEAVLLIAKEKNLITYEEYEQLRENKETNFNKSATPIKPKVQFESAKGLNDYKNDIGTPQELNSIYEIFALGYSLIGKDKLTLEHREEIKAKRFLSDDEIEEDGYFTFPDMSIMDALLEEMHKRDIGFNLLKKIPGFYFSVPKNKWCFTALRGTSGVGIPIKDLNGNIIGIQIRLDEVSEKSKRYQWFSSSFANRSNDGEKKAKTIYGTSPGAPIAVVKPHKMKNKALFITEGFFKARAIAKHYGSYAVSVQGVTNWKNIVETIHDIMKSGIPIICVYIAFDGDMCRKDTVIKPAVKMAFALTGLNFPDKLNENMEKILKSSNRSVKEKTGNFRKESEEIAKFLVDHKKEFTTRIQFLLWNEMLGKGIDDILNTGFAGDTIRPMDFIDFWNNTFELLSELDDIREQRANETNVPFRKVVIEDDIKQDLFKKHIDNKLV